jgi:hypothetical protein
VSGGSGSEGVRGSRRRDRDFQVFSMSFLDAICCAFGALILIMVLAQVGRPQVIAAIDRDLGGLIARREAEIAALDATAAQRGRELAGRRAELASLAATLAQLRGELARTQGAHDAAGGSRAADAAGAAAAARQALTAEMARLLGPDFRRGRDAPVGGVPADSEYVIFLIDTSGSMQSYSWALARQKLREVLDLYPHLKGIQVMSDQGYYMFGDSRGQWLADTPARRQAILAAFDGWNAFSASSPAEGILAAIRTFATPAHKLSLYVFGDEFTGASIQEVVEAIDRSNRRDAAGGGAVRIHYIGFPLDPQYPQFTNTRLATLMRIICERNGGSFVGLVR